MRKHRIFGVVIAVLIGLGVFTHRSDAAPQSSGSERAGAQFATAELSAARVGAGAHAPVVTDTSTPPNTALVNLMAGHAATILSSPFGPQALVLDFHIAQLNERAEVSVYLAAVAQNRAMTKAYLQAVAPHPKPVTAVRASAPTSPAVARDPWPALRQCESGGNYGDNTGNGYYGAYQFTAGTWASLGLRGLPSQSSPAQQDQAAQELQARRGWGQWPSCARRLGLL
jgi:hypothetical protein